MAKAVCKFGPDFLQLGRSAHVLLIDLQADEFQQVEGTVLVDIQLLGEIPRGVRPDLSVDGTIELERLDDVLHVGSRSTPRRTVPSDSSSWRTTESTQRASRCRRAAFR